MHWPFHKTFANGVHPPEHKEQTRGLPIRQFPFAPRLAVPLAHRPGAPVTAVVRAGQEVTRGQVIAQPNGAMSVAMHAPVSGVVEKLDLMPSLSGAMVPGIYITPFPASTQEVGEGAPCVLGDATPDDILHAIQNAGIVGLGGAAFPTHVKLHMPAGTHLDTLLVNGAECEPYLTTDHRVMLEQTQDILLGIRYIMKATGAPRTIIAVEENKADAAQCLRAALPRDAPIEIAVLKVKYPQGAEKVLIKTLFGREVPSGGHAHAVGVVTINVATAAEIGRLLPRGRGIQERVVTFAGGAMRDPGNYRIPIGTPLRFALDTVGVRADVQRVVIGGPMMGSAVTNLDIPITKGDSGVLALDASEISATPLQTTACIRCALCVQACPLHLNPAELNALGRNQQYERMAAQFHLHDCFECGACAYVCPAHIPLVQQFRGAKAALKRGVAA